MKQSKVIVLFLVLATLITSTSFVSADILGGSDIQILNLDQQGVQKKTIEVKTNNGPTLAPNIEIKTNIKSQEESKSNKVFEVEMIDKETNKPIITPPVITPTPPIVTPTPPVVTPTPPVVTPTPPVVTPTPPIVTPTPPIVTPTPPTNNSPVEVPVESGGSGWSDWSDWSDFDGFDDFNSPYQGSSNNNSYESNVPGYSDDFGFGFIEIVEDLSPEDKLMKTKKTFQYSISPEGRYPFFIDTGIPYVEGIIPKAEDLKEILRQISVKTNAKLISDDNRFLILANDAFEIVDGNTEDASTLVEAFKKVGVTLRIQSSRSGHKFNLADYLENEGDLSIEVDGEEVELIVDAEISDSRVLLPIRSIGNALGAEVNWNQATKVATIAKDEISIKIEANKDIVTVNGKEYLLGQPTRMNESDERILSLVNLIVIELGGQMRWDSTARVLKITSIEVEIEDDYY